MVCVAVRSSTFEPFGVPTETKKCFPMLLFIKKEFSWLVAEVFCFSHFRKLLSKVASLLKTKFSKSFNLSIAKILL